MANIDRCSTCKHWDAGNEIAKFCSEGRQFRFGRCLSDKLIDDDGDHSSADVLMYPFSEGGDFYPGQDFGCVHHEPHD